MNIAVFGAKGRVGSKVVEIAEKRGHKVYTIDIKNDAKSTKNSNTYARIDVTIDFSVAAATKELCDFCRLHNCPLVSGVTGRNEQQEKEIEQLSNELPVVCKSNFSFGVGMLHRICELVAKELPNWDCEIVEIHRRGKLDAPSGTAKSLAATVAQQKSFKKVTIHSLRCGSNFGKHEIVFATNGESLTLTHQAENVEIFALGAVLEAEKLIK